MAKTRVFRSTGPRRLLLSAGEIVLYLTLAVALPAAIRPALGGVDTAFGSEYVDTIIATAISAVFVVLVNWKFASYAKMGSISAPVLSVGLVYGTMFLILLLFQAEYARFQLLSSLLVALALSYVTNEYRRGRLQLRYGYIDQGRAARVVDAQGRTWVAIDDPDAEPADLDGLVADLDVDFDDRWKAFIAHAALAGIPIFHHKDIIEKLTGMVRIESLSEKSFSVLDPDNYYIPLKYLVDWVVAALFLPLLAPVLAACALWIRLDSAGPVLFQQPRVGAGGKLFTIYKFRSMRVHKQGEHATQADDPRITLPGRFLRKYRLDELPQVFNILRGEMSWIGPRPESLPLAQAYESEIPLYAYRHMVRPGLTGWAQVNQGNTATLDDARLKLNYDFYYIKHVSIWLDIVIVLKTIYIMVTGWGSK